MLKKKLLMATIGACLSFSLAACTPAAQSYDLLNGPRNNGNGSTDYNRVGYDVRNPVGSPQLRPLQRRISDDGFQRVSSANPHLYTGRVRNVNNVFATADRMAELAAAVPGVERATAVIVGSTAYVGLSLDDGVTGEEQQRIKRNVLQQLNFTIPVYRYQLTLNESLMDEIRETGNGWQQGRQPVQIPDQLRDLGDRLNDSVGVRRAEGEQ